MRWSLFVMLVQIRGVQKLGQIDYLARFLKLIYFSFIDWFIIEICLFSFHHSNKLNKQQEPNLNQSHPPQNNTLSPPMSSNNLYYQLIDIAKQQKITLSQTESARSSQHQVVQDEFTLQINDVKEKIALINQNNKQILAFRQKLSSNTIPAKQAQLHKHLQNLCDSNYEQICVLKNDLEIIGKMAKDAMASNPNQPQTNSKVYYRQYLTKEVEKIVRESNKINKLIEKYSINTSLKRIKALAPEMSDQQALKVAQKKNGFDQIVMAKTMGKASLKLKYRVDDILQKHQGILNLQKSVEENARLMNEVSFLVKQQGEMIDSVFDNILQAKDYVQKAEQVLANEKKNVKKSKKKMCCIILIGIIVLGLVLTPIIIKVTKKS